VIAPENSVLIPQGLAVAPPSKHSQSADRLQLLDRGSPDVCTI